MPRQPFPNFIIISGSGTKVGKTHLATALIRAFSVMFPLVALKISPHVHDSLGKSTLIAAKTGIKIFRDMEPHHKNSGKFLEAGARASFFMETDDRHLPEAFAIFMKKSNPMGHPVICESGALGNLIRPGLLVFISDPAAELRDHKLTALNRADIVLPARNFLTGEVIGRIRFSDNCWHETPIPGG